MDSASKTGKKNKSGAKVLSLLLILVLILGIGAFVASRYYMVVGGHLLRKDADELDLRGEEISAETYQEIQAKMPDADILWDVPLSGGAFSRDAQSISISAFAPEDIEKLSYFTSLRSVDATAADMTAEDYELLAQALPDCEIRWSVPVGGDRFASDAREITLTGLSAADLGSFDCFDGLETVDARACTDYEAILALQEKLPETEILWQVPLAGTTYLKDATEILIDDPAVTAQEVNEALKMLPAAAVVDAPVNTWTDQQKQQLIADWPQISFQWPVTIAGIKFDGTETAADFSGRSLSASDLAELRSSGKNLPGLQKVDLTGTGVSLEDVLALKEAIPQADFLFDFELYGVPINSMDTFIDFTGKTMESPDTVESILPLMPCLEKVDMSDCGISDEDMDALNKRHDDVRFVWTMHITRYNIRTDDVGFIGSMEHYGAFDATTIRKLIYCEDMICLDLGHRIPFDDLSFLYEMPQVQYLVLADCRTYDISPIGSLKDLCYLEMILSYATDLSPLQNCPKLVDLNVCFCNNTDKDKNFEVFSAMSGQLERLWYSSFMIAEKQRAELQEKMPNTEIHCIYAITDATGQRWRYSKHYYEMRDLLNMFYMGDYGGRQYTKTIDGVEIPLDPEFIANQRLPDFSKMRY